MFWKRWCRSFIRLIGGFILLKSCVIYTHADIDVYIFNSNISSNCIIIKTMGAASRSSRRTAAADNQCEDCRAVREFGPLSDWGFWIPVSPVRAWARLDTQGLGLCALRVARASQEHLTRLTQTTTYPPPTTKHQHRLHPPTEATPHSAYDTHDKYVW